MSEYAPTTENVRQTFAYVQAGLDDDDGYPFVTHIHVETFDRWLAEVERAAAEKARSDLMIELLPVLEDAVLNARTCQNDRGVGNEWDEEIARAETALERAKAYRRDKGEKT